MSGACTVFDAEVTVRRTRFASEETRLGGGRGGGDDGTPVVLVGPLVHLEERERARVVGDVGEGQPLRAAGEGHRGNAARPPTDADGGGDRVPGPRQARRRQAGATRLVETYGAGAVFDVDRPRPVRGLHRGGHPQRQRPPRRTSSWERLRVTRRLHLLLAPHGLAYLAARIRETVRRRRAPDRVRASVRADERVRRRLPDRRPDRAAARRRAGQPATAPRAAVLHVLSEAERGGSTCLPLELLVSPAARAARTATESTSRRSTSSSRRRSRSRRAVDLPDADRRARGRAGRARPRRCVRPASAGAPPARDPRRGSADRR